MPSFSIIWEENKIKKAWKISRLFRSQMVGGLFNFYTSNSAVISLRYA